VSNGEVDTSNTAENLSKIVLISVTVVLYGLVLLAVIQSFN
jgi:hypothetical protein